MTDRKLWKAEDLEKLSPPERSEIIRSGIVTDQSEVPDALLARTRANVAEHITTTDTRMFNGYPSLRAVRITTTIKDSFDDR